LSSWSETSSYTAEAYLDILHRDSTVEATSASVLARHFQGDVEDYAGHDACVGDVNYDDSDDYNDDDPYGDPYGDDYDGADAQDSAYDA
jgi:hypothetical protein